MISEIVNRLLTPFCKSEAFIFGVISESGEVLDHDSALYTKYYAPFEEQFAIKTMMLKNLSETNFVDSLIAATQLTYDNAKSEVVYTEQDYKMMLKLVESDTYIMGNEMLDYFTSIFEDGEIANTTGAAVSTNEPVVNLKDGKPVSGILGTPNYMARRKKKELNSTELTSV